MKTRFSTQTKVQAIVSKLEKLLKINRKGCLNVEMNGRRYYGTLMKNIVINGEKISFTYGEQAHSFIMSDVKMVKRLRTRRYLLCMDNGKMKVGAQEEAMPEAMPEEGESKKEKKGKKKKEN